MKDRLKKYARIAKEEIKTHRGKIVFCLCLSAHVYITTKQAKDIEGFLTRKGLDPHEFWLTPEDYEALRK